MKQIIALYNALSLFGIKTAAEQDDEGLRPMEMDEGEWNFDEEPSEESLDEPQKPAKPIRPSLSMGAYRELLDSFIGLTKKLYNSYSVGELRDIVSTGAYDEVLESEVFMREFFNGAAAPEFLDYIFVDKRFEQILSGDFEELFIMPRLRPILRNDFNATVMYSVLADEVIKPLEVFVKSGIFEYFKKIQQKIIHFLTFDNPAAYLRSEILEKAAPQLLQTILKNAETMYCDAIKSGHDYASILIYTLLARDEAIPFFQDSKNLTVIRTYDLSTYLDEKLYDFENNSKQMRDRAALRCAQEEPDIFIAHNFASIYPEGFDVAIAGCVQKVKRLLEESLNAPLQQWKFLFDEYGNNKVVREYYLTMSEEEAIALGLT